MGHRKIVKYILSQGADDWNAKFQSILGSSTVQARGTVIDLAIDKGFLDIVQELLEYADNSPHKLPLAIGMSTLQNVILLGRTRILRYLFDTRLGLRQVATSSPWFLFEAAAACRDRYDANDIVNMLLEMGCDNTSTSSLGLGSMLAAATKVSNLQVIWRILIASFPVNGLAAGYFHIVEPGTLGPYEERMRGIHRRSALHVAINCGQVDLVELLLDHGADVEQVCGLLPVQAAALSGNHSIVTLLIQAGADVNATCNPIEDAPSEDLLPHALSALQIALMNEHAEAGEVLFNVGGSPLVGVTIEHKQAVLAVLVDPIVKLGSERFSLKASRSWFEGERQLTEEQASCCVTRFILDFFRKFAENSGVLAPADRYQPSSTLCEAIVKGQVTQALLKHIPPLEDLSTQHGIRALVLTTQVCSERMVTRLPGAGVCPFDLIGDAEDEASSQVGSRFKLTWGESAFTQAVTSSDWNLMQIYLSLDHLAFGLERRYLRHQQMCKVYASAISHECEWLENLLLQHDIHCQFPTRAPWLGYFERAMYAELVLSATLGACQKVQRILDHHNCPHNLIERPRRSRSMLLDCLQYLAFLNETRLVQRFLELGADANVEPRPVKGATALQFAAKNGNFEIVNMLLDAGARINASPADIDGRTAIEGAAEWGRLDMVFHLPQKGADVQNKFNYRRTIYRAWTNGHRTVAQMVQKWRTRVRGEDDCGNLADTVEKMTQLQLDYVDGAAFKRRKCPICRINKIEKEPLIEDYSTYRYYDQDYDADWEDDATDD